MGRLSGAPFRRHRHGVRVQLAAPERELLVDLLEQLDELLDDGHPVADDPLAELAALMDGFTAEATGPDGADAERHPSDDPALERLLPDAHRDDPELAAEFRRLTETGLRGRKRAGARRTAELLRADDPVLAPDDVPALLKALTDLRLVLGARLGLETDEDAELLHRRLAAATAADEPWAAAGALFGVLGWWQESLIDALGPPGRAAHGP